MPFKTIPEMRKAVASILGLSSEAALATHWDDLINNGTEGGREHIKRAIGGKGYTEGQIANWDGLAYWHRIASLYCIFSDANLDDDRSLQQLNNFRERLTQLDKMESFQVSGRATDPAGESSVGFGEEDTVHDRYTRDMTL